MKEYSSMIIMALCANLDLSILDSVTTQQVAERIVSVAQAIAAEAKAQGIELPE